MGPVGSFQDFPPTFIHYGDAERLQKEIEYLIVGMKRDGVPTEVHMTVDGVHDLLMVRFWNEEVRSAIYEHIADWMEGLKGDAGVQRLGYSSEASGSAAQLLVQVDSDEDAKGSA